MPGLTFTRRTASAFSCRPLPAGSIFSESGMMIFHSNKKMLSVGLAYLMTNTVRTILEMFVGSGEASHAGSAARHFLAGVVSKLPFPKFEPEQIDLLEKAGLTLAECTAGIADYDETRRSYSSTFVNCESLSQTGRQLRATNRKLFLKILDVSFEVENIVRDSLFLDEQAVKVIEQEMSRHPASYEINPVAFEVKELLSISDDELAYKVYAVKPSRGITKLSYFANRRIELLSQFLQTHPTSVPEEAQSTNEKDLANLLINELIGFNFAR